MTKPWELERAEFIDGLCQRYGCLPSQLLEEPVDMLRMLSLIALAHPKDDIDGQ